jgi:hypothetical protein
MTWEVKLPHAVQRAIYPRRSIAAVCEVVVGDASHGQEQGQAARHKMQVQNPSQSAHLQKPSIALL